jgi:hypothetical protein
VSFRLPTSTLFICLLLATAACGGGSDGPVDPATRLGPYALRTVGGQSLPASTNIVLETGTITSISSGRLTLHDNTTHTSALEITFRATGSSTSQAGTLSFGTGVYTIDGSAVNFARENGPTFTGAFSGSTGLSVTLGTPYPVMSFRKDQ